MRIEHSLNYKKATDFTHLMRSISTEVVGRMPEFVIGTGTGFIVRGSSRWALESAGMLTAPHIAIAAGAMSGAAAGFVREYIRQKDIYKKADGQTLEGFNRDVYITYPDNHPDYVLNTPRFIPIAITKEILFIKHKQKELMAATLKGGMFGALGGFAGGLIAELVEQNSDVINFDNFRKNGLFGVGRQLVQKATENDWVQQRLGNLNDMKYLVNNKSSSVVAKAVLFLHQKDIIQFPNGEEAVGQTTISSVSADTVKIYPGSIPQELAPTTAQPISPIAADLPTVPSADSSPILDFAHPNSAVDAPVGSESPSVQDLVTEDKTTTSGVTENPSTDQSLVDTSGSQLSTIDSLTNEIDSDINASTPTNEIFSAPAASLQAEPALDNPPSETATDFSERAQPPIGVESVSNLIPIDQLPSEVALPSNSTVWNQAESLLQVYKPDYSQADVLSLAKEISIQSNITVEEWGVYGNKIDTNLSPIQTRLILNTEVKKRLAQVISIN